MNLSRLALVGCVLALCFASVQAQQPYPANNAGQNYPSNNAGQTYTDSGYADGGPVNGDYADDDGSYADGDYCDGCNAGIGDCLGYLFGQRRGLFYFTAEALALRRNNQAIRQDIVVDSFGTSFFNTRSLHFPVMIGQKYTAGYMFDEQTMVEATYFSIDSWSYRNLLSAPGDIYLPDPLGRDSFDYQGADNVTLNYSARLLNGELNFIRPFAWPDIGFLAGFRYLQLNEQFNIHAVHVDQTGFAFEASDYNTKTRNNLYGGQIGTRIRKQLDLFGIECTAKAGLYDNDARERNIVFDQNNSVILRPMRGGNTHSAAFVGDVNVTGTYRFNPSFLFRFGYNVLWVERVALAPDQLNFADPGLATSGGGINHHGGFFAHGVNSGFEARF